MDVRKYITISSTYTTLWENQTKYIIYSIFTAHTHANKKCNNKNKEMKSIEIKKWYGEPRYQYPKHNQETQSVLSLTKEIKS